MALGVDDLDGAVAHHHAAGVEVAWLGLGLGLGLGSGLGLANPNPNPNPNPNLHEREELRLEHERHLGAVLAQQLHASLAHRRPPTC